jgi:DNA-binding NarL/FixJ family response regulator
VREASSEASRCPGVRACPEGAAGAAPVGKGTILCDDHRVPVTVVIVDDHSSFRRSARELLEVEGFDVVGEAADGLSGLRLARELEPELVLLDVALPDMSGFDVAAGLAGTPSKVILTSSREGSDYGGRVRRSGALGFVPKDGLTPEALNELLERSG